MIANVVHTKALTLKKEAAYKETYNDDDFELRDFSFDPNDFSFCSSDYNNDVCVTFKNGISVTLPMTKTNVFTNRNRI